MMTLWLLLISIPSWAPMPPALQQMTPRQMRRVLHLPEPQPVSVTVDAAWFPLSPGYHLIRSVARLDKEVVPVTFGVFLPRAYFETHDPMPVAVALHTRGASGADGRERYINEELALLTTTTREDSRTHGDYPKVRLQLHAQGRYICLMPQCPNGFKWETPPIGRILAAEVALVVRAYHADADRVYLTGYSYGGSSTWTVALQVPDVFAAIAPIDARATPHPAQDVKRLASVPIYLAVGQDDHDFVLACNRMRDAITGIAHADFVYRTVPHGNHFCYPCVYEDPAFWDWMFAHRRVRLTAATPEPARATAER